MGISDQGSDRRREERRRRRRLKGMSFNVMIPNILTLLALCAGLTSVRFALNEHWELAALAIAVAALLDALDGRVARLLKGSSKFGAELDSLSDFVCFGVAPAMILYLWGLQDAGRFVWIAVLIFSASCGMRLARFNTMLDDPNAPPWQPNYFTGVPAPAGAGLVLLPLILSFQIGDSVRHPAFIALVMVAVATLLVSRVPTFSFKRAKIAGKWFLPAMFVVVVFAAGTLSAPWTTLTVILVAYLASIPMSLTRHARQMKAWKQQHPEYDTDAADIPADKPSEENKS